MSPQRRTKRSPEYCPDRHRLAARRPYELLWLRPPDHAAYRPSRAEGALFENTYSAFIPTTSAYASMLTGMDVFSTQVVALRHQGPMRDEVQTLAEVLREGGYNTTCVGFRATQPRAASTNTWTSPAGAAGTKAAAPRPRTSTRWPSRSSTGWPARDKPFFLFLRHMDPHAPYLPPAPFERMFYHGNECDPSNKSMQPVMAFKPFRDFFASWMPPGITR